MSAFKELNQIDVNDKVKGKGGLTYLSWAWAWAELKKRYPESTSKVYETESGRIYWDDGNTAWVKVSVTVEGLEHVEYLPIMDFKNRSIPLKEITSFEVNKSIQRAITKAIGRHGLGLYIYAGEDLPEDEATELLRLVRNKYAVINKDDPASLADFIKDAGIEPKDIPTLDVEGLKSLLDDLNKNF